jgi:hypothetical protein
MELILKSLFFLTLFMLICPLSQSFAIDHSHKDWTELLKEYQSSNGLVRYKKLKEDTKKSKDHKFLNYLQTLQDVSLKDYQTFSKNEKMAFLINAYNAFTIKLIVDNYPVKSIKKIGSFFTNAWKQEFFSLLDGQIKSLDPIEHKWLRPKFKDYRIHAAVNCASISCPPLRNEAYVGVKLDQQLDEQMKFWLEDPKRNKFDFKANVYTISKIFDWYAKDFQDWGGGVTKVIDKYIKKTKIRPDKPETTVKYLNYDWNLNETI